MPFARQFRRCWHNNIYLTPLRLPPPLYAVERGQGSRFCKKNCEIQPKVKPDGSEPKADGTLLTNKQRDALWGYAFIAPQMIGFFILIIVPLITIFVFSTEQRNLLTGIINPVGLDNYRTIFSERHPVQEGADQYAHLHGRDSCR